MIINSIQNNNSYKSNFTGSVKDLPLYTNYALEYAKGVKVTDGDWSKLKIFINTIRAIKNDGTNNELIIETVQKGNNKNWFIKYGDYITVSDVFETKNFNPSSYSDKKTGKDAFYKIVEFGKKHFGLPEVSKPITEFTPANPFLKRATNFLSKSRSARDKDTARSLEAKVALENQKAEDAISSIKSKILSELCAK